MPLTHEPRKRGPRSTGDARADILDAARAEFADKGYAAASLRGIARRAGVDPALIHHYFDGKSELFTATMNIDLNPAEAVKTIVTGPRAEAGERVVRTFLGVWDAPQNRGQLVGVVRTVLLGGALQERNPVSQFILPELLMRICVELEVDDPMRRAGLIGSQMVGLLVTRYLIELPPVVQLSQEDAIATFGETIRRYLFD